MELKALYKLFKKYISGLFFNDVKMLCLKKGENVL